MTTMVHIQHTSDRKWILFLRILKSVGMGVKCMYFSWLCPLFFPSRVSSPRVLAAQPRNVDALSCRAYAFRKQHKLQEAAEGYAAALAAAGPDAECAVLLRLHNAHGYCLAMQGNLHAAVAAYSAALALEPDNAHALHNRGTTLAQAGDVAAAVRDLEALVVLDPGNQAARQQLEAVLAQRR